MATVSRYAARVIDIIDEPKRMLTPIRGFEKEPLVTLEEAVQTLTEDVPDVEQMVWIVKKQCPNVPDDDLTIDECSSIMLYTLEWTPSSDSLYSVLNRRLRDVDRKRLVPWFSYLKLLIWSLSKLPSRTCTVFRGVRDDLHDLYQTSSESIWWAFSSCTTTVAVLESEQFLGKKGKRTIFSIECHTAKDIQKHSFYPNENEVLLMPARQFKVKSCLDMGHDLHMIQLDEIDPPFPLIQIAQTSSTATPKPQMIAKPSSSKKQPKPVQTSNVSNPNTDKVPDVPKPNTQTQINIDNPLGSFGNLLDSFTSRTEWACPCCKKNVWAYQFVSFVSGSICFDCQEEHGNTIPQHCSRRTS